MTPALTIFTDASYHRQHGTAGWGAWMHGERTMTGPVTMGGQIKELVVSSSEAEMLAISNALHVAVQRAYVVPGETVHIVSDSNVALGWILRLYAKASHQRLEGVPVTRPRKLLPACASSAGAAALVGICTPRQLTLIVSHIRAHQTEGNAQSAINAYCDAIAKKHQAERLRKHKSEASNEKGRPEDRPSPDAPV